MAFPGPNSEIYYNEAGEPLGWDNVSYDDPRGDDEEDDFDYWDEEEDDDDDDAEVVDKEPACRDY